MLLGIYIKVIHRPTSKSVISKIILRLLPPLQLRRDCCNIIVLLLFVFSSDVDALVGEIMAKEPLVTRSKADQVKSLIESELV